VTPGDFQQRCLRTARSEALHIDERQALLLECALGLAGEASEFSEAIKKHFFHGHALDLGHLAEELGDTLWYAAVAAHALGFALDDIMQRNVDKLTERYPDGFDSTRSINRADVTAS
jgi:NTP pyrophosphatase (non-canonical NTP hydrolase)